MWENLRLFLDRPDHMYDDSATGAESQAKGKEAEVQFDPYPCEEDNLTFAIII